MAPLPSPRTLAQLEAGLAWIRESPSEIGRLELIVRRPAVDQRESLVCAELSPDEGLRGDSWKTRGSSRSPSGSALAERQITLMNSRAIALIAQRKERWALAGDQLYVDLDLSGENLPAGSRLGLGSAVLEITPPPHTGCKKFVRRFGLDAVNFVNSSLGRQLRLRGVHARVVRAGSIQVGQPVTKLLAGQSGAGGNHDARQG